MEMKSHITLEHTKESGKTYHFHMPSGAPLGECYDVLFDFARKVLELSEQSVKNMEKEGEDHG